MKHSARRSLLALLPTVLLLALSSCGSTPPTERNTTTVEPRPWPHEHSDIPVDPRIHFGHLMNGVRWAWAANAKPEERCYVRLHVNVGSLAEEESERGMAHFLEHMAFNGSEHFPAGTLIEWFQDHGMSFGADTNAHTGFSETVYKLDLPQADAGTVREGLAVLRDFADGLLLEPSEIHDEKGVIDGEERERDSASFRVLERQLALAFAGTRVGERLPIGLKKARDAFDAKSVRAFYERWYRPESMTLVLVGDLGDLNPEALFSEAFADMGVPSTPLALEPTRGHPDHYNTSYVIFEDEIPTVSLTVARQKPWEQDPLTIEQQLEDLPLAFARGMLNLRFSELAKDPDAPFLAASDSGASALDVIDGEELDVTCAPERWEEALAFCERELRKALQFGFQEPELEELRANSLRGLAEAVERESTTPSGALLASILSTAEEPFVPEDAATRRSILAPAIRDLDLEACNAAFREAWGEGELSLQSSGHLDLGEGGAERLLAAYDESTADSVEENAAIEEQTFAYASSPKDPGVVVWREEVEDLGFTEVRFANGVALNVKHTDLKEKQILLYALLGEGRLTLDPARSDLLFVAQQAFPAAGLEAHSVDDLRRLLAGKQVGLSFQIGEDSFYWSGSTTAEDLLLECELLCANLQAPGWREDGLVQVKRQLPLMFDGLKHRPQGPYVLDFRPALYSNDPRFCLFSQEAAAAIGMDAVKAWLAPELAQDALEVSLVGDLDVEEAIRIAARTLGKLPPRRAWREFSQRRGITPPLSGLHQEREIDSEIPKSLVLINFPIPDATQIPARWQFEVLADVLNDRLRVEVRERLGAAYSPGASAHQSKVLEGDGLILIQAMADPDKVETLLDACLASADSLAKDGLTEEEVERLRGPILNQLRDAKSTNDYWLLSVLYGAQRDPEHLDQIRAADEFYEAYSAADLSPLAQRYLNSEEASVLIVNPKQ